MEGANERERVDNALNKAHEIIKGLEDGQAKSVLQVALLLAEMHMRQVRDADDTQYQLKEVIETGMADFITFLNDGLFPRLDAIASSGNENKRWGRR